VPNQQRLVELRVTFSLEHTKSELNVLVIGEIGSDVIVLDDDQLSLQDMTVLGKPVRAG